MKQFAPDQYCSVVLLEIVVYFDISNRLPTYKPRSINVKKHKKA